MCPTCFNLPRVAPLLASTIATSPEKRDMQQAKREERASECEHDGACCPQFDCGRGAHTRHEGCEKEMLRARRSAVAAVKMKRTVVTTNHRSPSPADVQAHRLGDLEHRQRQQRILRRHCREREYANSAVSGASCQQRFVAADGDGDDVRIVNRLRNASVAAEGGASESKRGSTSCTAEHDLT